MAAALEPFVRVVVHDRAGFGRSEPAPSAPTPDENAQDLRVALAAAGARGPYLLVGQGRGASTMRLFAHRFRRDVAGLLLLDPWPERFAALAPAAWRRRESRRRRFLHVQAAAVRATALPLLLAPAPVRARSGLLRVAAVATARYGEALRRDEGDREVAALPSLGDLPVLVHIPERDDRFASLGPAHEASAWVMWRRLQEELAARSSRGRLAPPAVRAGRATAPADEPALLRRLVEELLAEAAG